MKTLIGALVLSFGFSASANNALCARTELSFNTHPDNTCPVVEAFCLTAEEDGDLLITVDGVNATLKSKGATGQENYSDVGAALYQAFDLNGMQVKVTLASDGSWPIPTRQAGFEGLSIFTGVQGRSGVYVSQICQYEIK